MPEVDDRQRPLEPLHRARGRRASTGRGCSTTSPTALGKLNLNIASAHIATFGEKAVDVFYVTDLTGTKITHPSRQAALRRALLDVFERDGAAEPTQGAAGGGAPAEGGRPEPER